MPIEPSSFRERADGGKGGPLQSDPAEHVAPRIRAQAAEIIATVLAGTESGQATARTQLRELLAANPDRPEVALVEHLIALRRRTGSSSAPANFGPLTGSPSPAPVTQVGSRVESMLQGRMLITAFQPICSLSHGGVVGAQALTRFFSEVGGEAADWFAMAKQELLGSELEFAALESALEAAQDLPPHLYVALKISPATCLDPLLPELLNDCPLDLGRLVLELTEEMTREQPLALAAALAPLRRGGVRLSVDHAGSHFTSLRHIGQLKPDIIKLDRTLVARIEEDPLRSSLAEAMVGFATYLDAVVIAQGIETFAELEAVRNLGVAAVQGYLLGTPTTNTAEWAGWTQVAQRSPKETIL